MRPPAHEGFGGFIANWKNGGYLAPVHSRWARHAATARCCALTEGRVAMNKPDRDGALRPCNPFAVNAGRAPTPNLARAVEKGLE